MAKILVVDDSETVRNRLITDLEAVGHVVLEADNGVKGLQTLDSNQDTNIVISDVNMPEMDGITMCSKINEKPEFKDVHLFVLTTEFDQELKNKGKQAGVKLWITKPVKMPKLIEVIQKILDR
ncbi:MAG: response regulator [Proteobacteria bacterium]|nr:response regulator [Pseudomonadota bacterium]